MRERASSNLFNTRQVAEAFSRAADTYEPSATLQRETARQSITALARHLTQSRPLILDAGAGTGHIAAHAATSGLDWNLLALDLSEPMCRLATRYNQTVIRGDMARVPFANQSLDGVISSLALQWASNPAVVLDEFARATRPGGWAVIATFGPRTLHELATTFESLDGNRRVTSFPSLDRLSKLASLAGWRVVKCHDQTRYTHHEHLADLMRSLKAIGATDRRSTRRRGLTAPALFRQAANHYPRRTEGISATWNILTLILQMPR